MHACILGEEIKPERVSPGKHRHFVIQRRGAREAEVVVVERPVLEAVRRPDPRGNLRLSKKKERPVKQMAPEVGQNAQSRVAPG